ncbi:MAG: hypothetical protein QM765_33370 [Myxococcales bacterium]
MSEPSTTPAANLEKKVVRTSPVLWILGGALALLLSGLGTQALEDLADLFAEPQREGYLQPKVEPLRREREALSAAEDPRRVPLQRAEDDLRVLERTVSTAEQGWRTWLETRATLGPSSGEDQELRSRRDKLDGLRQERDRASQALEAMRREPDPRTAALADLDRRIAEAERAADGDYAAAHRVWTLKVLAARLGLVVPIWAFAAWLWARRRESRYITLLWGYWAFSVWMLFWGIGPYLPHYGGYFPLAIGAVVTVWVSVSLVRYFNLRAPMRRRKIVDRAIARHRCPNCDRDYLLGREVGTDIGLARKSTTRRYDAEALRPHACPACGLPLFAECPACKSVQVVHLDACASCGASWPPAT